ncbi:MULTISPECIES: LptA/OstA family protein [Synechocystis]|uniref:LptA/OstA family protein n=1 Tax=Synechocystis salina LEGE 00031 TaxID=1828736 RepID=A0ABR9VQP8_9SYNC|nr:MULTISPECIES: LptA/OstA family protein [Synechocystis]MBD2654141.1 LptA/OstA family protein [Synechocystis sp. FACHB-383]MBE9241549.1 LptA/OstA family protein [Synechocystis salina LEGE 00041]MBE9253233.1 LptA/OstA family protein [Synechocystis salina LEGE 00031]
MVRLPMVFPQHFSPSRLLSRHWGWLAIAVAALGSLTSLPVNNNSSVVAQTAPSSPMTVRSDIQEANSQTGVVTARGNVQVYYPARNLQATAAQAQYFSQERRLVLSGNVYVLQDGNSMRAETMTYLVDEGRFVANPEANQQVESIYLVEESQNPAGPSPTGPNPLPGDTLPDLPPLGS